MASNNATDLVPPQVRESVFHSAVFLPSSHSMTLGRLLASALKPSSLLSRAATAWFGIANAAPHRRSSNLAQIPVTHTGAHMAGHLPHSGNHPRCTIASAPRTVRSLHEFRFGTITTVPFLYYSLELILSTVVIIPCRLTTPIQHAARSAIAAAVCAGLRTHNRLRPPRTHIPLHTTFYLPMQTLEGAPTKSYHHTYFYTLPTPQAP